MVKTPFKRGIAFALVCALGASSAAFAQVPGPMSLPYGASQASAPAFNQDELDQMLAPVALYPDALLAQVLMAATYPAEVVEAARWAQQHNGLTGPALQNALQGEPWDASVKSLCQFPALLDRMSQGLAWTQRLGDAFIEQQQQVMDSVQELRRRAQFAGNLQSNPQQTVVAENGAITILPANPQIVYVPTYNPAFAYGNWWRWAAYPAYYPSYWGPAGDSGFFWGLGVAAGVGLWGGFDWHRHEVNIRLDRYNEFNRTHIADNRWHHDEMHRGGIPYRRPDERFGAVRGGTIHEGGFEHEGGAFHIGGVGHEGGHGGGHR